MNTVHVSPVLLCFDFKKTSFQYNSESITKQQPPIESHFIHLFGLNNIAVEKLHVQIRELHFTILAFVSFGTDFVFDK